MLTVIDNSKLITKSRKLVEKKGRKVLVSDDSREIKSSRKFILAEYPHEIYPDKVHCFP